MSRTHLKQQLMREQSQELEKREKKKEYLTSTSESSTSAVSVPFYSPPLIPSNLLTYQSKLDHPTGYHIKEIQNRRVQEFLSQARRPETTRSLPSEHSGVNVDTSPTDLIEALNNSTASPVETEEFWQDFKNSKAFSESMADSGVEPSFSPNSDNDMIEMFSTFPTLVPVYASCPAGVNSMDDDPANMQEVLKKERQKKNNHNRIERNRRFVINDHIKELAVLMPKPQEPLYETVKDIRHSKGTILKASVAYVKALKEEAKKVPKLEENCYTNEQIIRRLKLKIQEYEIILSSNGILVPKPLWHPSTESDIKAIVKKEPNLTDESRGQSSTSVAQNSNFKLAQSSLTSDQGSRPSHPHVQFLSAQQNTTPWANPSEVVDLSSTSLEMRMKPQVINNMLEDLGMEDNLLSDVFFSSRDSHTPEDMDYISQK